ncbi:MAG: 1,2-dihydroxy-3-keto-5-methylthiopentene dioxygenase [Thelocarpon impressellum]|nr:MAG: 1,2-dihydroxy-3-keto-5-methylthiopentene dioxygenase [Thelocarpon impressellum]
MKAYFFDEMPGDQRAPHDSDRPVTAAYLSELGVLSAHHPGQAGVDALAAARGYAHRDEITVSPAALGPAYASKLEVFFAEHLHEDEEIRYVLDGAGYFDVRGRGDEWVRLRLEKGDLVVLPAGIWHRFTTDESDYIKAMRLFKDEPKWTPLNRSQELEGNKYRKEYLAAREAQTWDGLER